MTTDTSTRLLTEDEFEVVSGGMIAQKEGIDKNHDDPGAGFNPFNLDEWAALLTSEVGESYTGM